MIDSTLVISIIVPVYNTERYLSYCIDSILNQSFSNFELLLIDDGSTDGSIDICNVYAEKDNRIRIFHKKNGGVSSARNMGLDKAKGEWVAFVDSDDLLPKDSLEQLMQKVSAETDMVYGEIRKFADNDDNIEIIGVKNIGVISIGEALDAFVVPKKIVGDWQRYMINRIYRMDIIKEFGLRFCTDIYYKEDGLFVIQYLCRCKNKVVCIPDVVYLYRQTDSSAMGKLAASFNSRLMTNVDAHGEIYKEIKKFGAEKEIQKRELGHLFQNYYWIVGIMENSNSNTNKNRRLLKHKLIKNGGLLNYLNYMVLRRYGKKIKRKLSL